MSEKWGKCMARNFGMLLAFLAFALLSTALLPSSSQAAPPKQVLVIHSYHMGFKWTDEMTQGITAALQDEGKAVQIRYEYMDTKRVSDPAYLRLLYETYKHKYRTSRFDVILATDNDAFDFLRQYRDDLFPAIPVIFCGVNYFKPSLVEGRKLITGVNEAADIKATLDLALRLHPATRQIVVINDTTTTGQIVHREVESLIPAYRDRVRFVFLEELEMPEILAAVHKLGPDSLVFYGLFFRDRGGRFFEYDEGISLIAEVSPVPVYGVWDFYLGYGLTGGMLASGYFQGETAGRMALRILRGEKVEDIPVVMKSPNRYMFDYRQLQRFHIDTSALPAGSIVINRPSSLYSVPRQVFWGAVAALVGSVLIITFLLYNTAIRRRAERELHKAAVKYRIVADNTYNWEFWLDPAGRFLYTSPSCKQITGHDAEEFNANPNLMLDMIHPDDLHLWSNHRHDVTDAEASGELEFRIVRPDGQISWIHHVCLPVFDDNGKFIGTRGSFSDITKRKQAEERNLRLEQGG
jgi:PAS domain S-box-containing protein